MVKTTPFAFPAAVVSSCLRLVVSVALDGLLVSDQAVGFRGLKV